MADRSVKVTLTAQVQSYIAGMEKAAQATRDTGSEAEKMAQKGQAFEQMGRAAMVAGGLVVGGLTIATKAAIDWDSAWAGVTKTVDGSPEQLAAVEDGLRGLTAVLPASHTEIAAVAEAAGQLGIQTPNVVEFTKTMIDLGETTNLSSEQAATSLARFMNVMGTSQSEVSALGSALVELGNNYATTEAEILEMSMRLSGAGRQIGMSEGEVLGLSTALSSVGIEAEAGGSAMSKVMIDIAASADKGGERLEMFAKVAGVSADDFAAKWKSDPGAALALFVQGLGDAEAQGTSTLGVLEELGITETRMRDALLRSASASDIFTEAMQQGNTAMGENTALTEEAEKRYATTAAQIQIMGNRVKDSAIGFGEHFLPVLEAGADVVGELAEAFGNLDGPMQAVVAWGAAIVGTGLFGAGLWMAAIPKIAAYKTALETLEITGSRLTRTLGLVAGAVGAVAVWGTLIAMAKLADAEVDELTKSLESNASAQELLDQASQANADRGLGNLVSGLTDTKVSAEDTADALDYLREKGEAGFMWTRRIDQGAIDNTLLSLEILGDELAKVGETDISGMQSQLTEMGESFSWTEDQMWSFIENSDDLKSALESQADSLGLSTDKADLLKIAFGEVKPANDEATDATDDNVASLEELSGIAQEASDDVSELADQIRNFGSAQIDSEQAAIKFYAELESLNELVASGASGLDLNTEAGRTNRQALLDIASAANDSAAATYAATGSQDEANAALTRGRDALVQAGIAFGMSEADALAYADQLMATPDVVSTRVEADVSAARDTIENFFAEVQGRRLTAYMEARTAALGPDSANGNLFEFANGGGLETGIYSGGPPITRFAEPETQWEAFISGKPDQRDRNRQIWMDTGDRLGMNPAGNSVPPVVYVENPWGAGYLLAKTKQVAESAIDQYSGQQSQAQRRAGR